MAPPPPLSSSQNARALGSPSIRPNTVSSNQGRSGSVTQTQTSVSDSPDTSRIVGPATLRLRGAHDPSEHGPRGRRPAIRWAEDVIDNEGLGRKKSKVCCIYHRPREVGESSSEDDDSSSSSGSDDASSDGGGGGENARPVGGSRRQNKKKTRREHRHHHPSGHDHQVSKRRRRPSPNAYERVPKPPNLGTTTGTERR